MDQVNLSAWEGKTETQTGVIQIAQALQIHATLGQANTSPPQEGEILPPLWHWFAFTPTVPNEKLARDGHPRLGDFLPPVPLERRMWASGALTFHLPLKVGVPFVKHSQIANVAEKEGRTGRMVFVTVDHRIETEDQTAIEERQDIVYLDIPDRFRPPEKLPMPEAPDWHSHERATEPLLFRFSAITFNAHRIHYDLPYAQQVEHYPGLVVHGPLQACWLIGAARAHRGTVPRAFRFRGVHPMLLIPGEPQEIDIMATGADGTALSLFTGQAGHQCMQATASWEETT
ncbi:FAS1-like dehydratase domain-containing protein [Roseovarius aestuariivivens]|uniref:FAS1-like dehydratase domain-containing protein n=1 Tax=Roseovarius aestuariivivens TaxID=1888910 RepID=UPI001080DEA6|nr:MaoC family dehydratase N-terminal domain-containing protein [Roseovarius aestuariivivens]